MLLLFLLGEQLISAGQAVQTPGYNFVYRNWNNQNGLPQNTVYSMVQDKMGYLWGATEEGLFRFDGSQFTYINEDNTPGLSSSTFYDLFSSGDDVWASSRNSIIRIRQKVEKVFDLTRYISGGWINCIEVDAAGRLWAGTTTGNLYYLRGDSVHACSKWDKNNGSIGTLLNTRDGIIIGTSKGLFTMNDPEGESKTIPQFADLNITATEKGSGEELWIATSNMGLFRLKNNDTTHFVEKDGLHERSIHSLYYSKDGKLWIGLRSAGYQVYYQDKFISPDQSPYDHDGIRSILITDQFVWLGTNSSGLLQMKTALITAPAPELQLSGKIILPVYQLPDGEIWIGTAGRGVYRYAAGKLSSFSQENGLSNNVVLSVYSRNEYVFIGTTSGMDRFNRNSGKLDRSYSKADGLKNNGVLCIFNDSKNQLWIATRQGGLHRMREDGSIEPFVLPASFEQSSLLCTFEDSRHERWFGSRGAGMMKIDSNDHVSTYQEKDSFPAGIVYAFYEDKEGDLWMATEKGLIVYYKGAFKLFNKESGLLFNEIYRILEDPGGHVWLSGNLGLQRVALNDLLDAKKTKQAVKLAVRLFNAMDGMPNSEANGGIFPAGWVMNDGALWFPTGQGVAVADQKLIREEPNDINIHVQSLRYGDMEYFPGEKIELHPGIHNFEIHYTSIDFGKADAIQFFYRLKGQDDRWTAAKNRRTAFFSGLKPGNYSFEVRAERYGKTSDIAVLNFTIKPRFYQTLFFKSGLLVLVLMLIAGIFYSIRRAARRRLREQQQIMRAQISGQEKERRFISTELHDSINQQLSTARMYLDAARENETLRKELVVKSEEVIRNAINDISLLCNSLTPPTLKDIGLHDAIEDLLSAYIPLNKFKAHLDFNLVPEKIEEDLQFILYRITQEQVNNIARHAEAKNVWLNYNAGPTGINITIRDDGKGFDVKTQRFGMGLQNIKNRLSLYHGKMEIKSAPGKGCTIVIFIPKKNIT